MFVNVITYEMSLPGGSDGVDVGGHGCPCMVLQSVMLGGEVERLALA